jgi:hypothetical protein
MKIQVPQPVDILAFVTAHFPGLVTVFSRLSARTVYRPPPRSLEQAVALHPAQQRHIGRHRSHWRLLLRHDREVVKMQLITPTGVLPVLLDQQLDQLGVHRGMLPVVGADFALERVDRPGFGAQRFVIPPLDGRKAENHPLSGNRVPPLFGGQFLELGLELTSGGRRSQKRPDDAEAKVRPALMRPRVG